MTYEYGKKVFEFENGFDITSKYWAKGGHERMYHTVEVEKGAYGVSNSVKALLEGAGWYTDLKTGELVCKPLPSKAECKCKDELVKVLEKKFTKKVEEVVEEVVVKRELTEEEAEDFGDVVAWERRTYGWDEIAELPKVAPDTRSYDEKYYSDDKNYFPAPHMHQKNFFEDAINFYEDIKFPAFLFGDNGYTTFESFSELSKEFVKVCSGKEFESVEEAAKYLTQAFGHPNDFKKKEEVSKELKISDTMKKLNKFPADLYTMVPLVLRAMKYSEVNGKKFDLEDFLNSLPKEIPGMWEKFESFETEFWVLDTLKLKEELGEEAFFNKDFQYELLKTHPDAKKFYKKYGEWPHYKNPDME